MLRFTNPRSLNLVRPLHLHQFVKMAVPRSRILDLMRIQCKIFSTTFNPEGLRLGNKILRQRLKGPSLAAYYPRKLPGIKELQEAYPEMDIIDEEEEDRLEGLRILKSRGKGAPKKKKTAEESKKAKSKKR